MPHHAVGREPGHFTTAEKDEEHILTAKERRNGSMHSPLAEPFHLQPSFKVKAFSGQENLFATQGRRDVNCQQLNKT